MRRLGSVIGAAAAAVVVLAATTVVPAEAATARQRLGSADVPAYCHMPAQRLHHSKTQDRYLPKRGSIDYQGARPIAVHLTRVGTQLLAQYECSAGGVGVLWPAVIVFYNRHNTLVAHLSLAHYTKAEHAAVTGWRADKHTVKLAWVSFQGAGTHLTHHHSTLTFSHGALHLS